MPYTNNNGADQPSQPRSLISAFVVRCLDSIKPLLAIAEISRPELVSVAEKANLSLAWSQTAKTGFLMTRLLLGLLPYLLQTKMVMLVSYLLIMSICDDFPFFGGNHGWYPQPLARTTSVAKEIILRAISLFMSVVFLKTEK